LQDRGCPKPVLAIKIDDILSFAASSSVHLKLIENAFNDAIYGVLLDNLHVCVVVRRESVEIPN
jgi:hypothetical protein